MEATPERAKHRLIDRAVPLLIAHAFSYPIAFVWAVAAIPIILRAKGAEWAASVSEETAKNAILLRAGGFALVAFLLEHGAAIPWSRAPRERASQRVFWIATAFLFGSAIGLGGAFWLPLLLE